MLRGYQTGLYSMNPTLMAISSCAGKFLILGHPVFEDAVLVKLDMFRKWVVSK